MRKLLLLLFLLILSLPVVAQNTPPEDNPNVTIHVVQRGENLFRIALEYGLTPEEIARVNGIMNLNNIQVGQRLLIPLVPSPVIVPPRTHTVRPGESLESIALVYGVDVQTIVQLNGIVNPNRLYVGQVLTIMPESEIPAAIAIQTPVALANVDTNTPTQTVTHIIQSGETLFTIAQTYGVAMEAIQAANGIEDVSVIFAGQEIQIPGVAAPELVVTLPASIANVEVTPTIWIEGKTGRMRLTTTNAATVTMNFLGRDLPVIQETPTSHLAYVGIPLNTEAAIYPFSFTITDVTGVTQFSVNVRVLAGNYGVQDIVLPEDRVNLAAPAVDENELALLTRVTTPFNPERYITAPMGLPAAAPMNAPFGVRRSYNGGNADRFHHGADFAGAPGTPVFAAAAGRVVLADTLNIRGVSVVLDHGWGIYTNYSHLEERYVNLGATVTAGQTLGTVGASGRATGAHLHWEVWVNGVPVDPMQWVYQAFP